MNENKKLIFYNNFHNGDIHASRQFVKDIISKINPKETEYHHVNSSTILMDIDLNHVKNKYNESNDLFVEDDDNIIINTWFHIKYGHKYHQCTIEALYYNFDIIYKKLGIKLEPIEYYIPEIDYKKFNVSNIDNFFKKKEFDKYIFLSNGEVRSFQSTNENMDIVVDELSENENHMIIISNESSVNKPNVILSKNIIGSDGTDDLNENSYITTKCDVIIGRESGPYFFSYVKENTKSDINQTIIVSSNVSPFLDKKYFNTNKKMYHYSSFRNIKEIKNII